MENLDAAIHKAFLPVNQVVSSQGKYLRLQGVKKLAFHPEKRDAAYTPSEHYGDPLIHGSYTSQESQVHDSLYGTLTVNGQAGLPGLEVVRDEMEGITDGSKSAA
jgi:hypothetical protein